MADRVATPQAVGNPHWDFVADGEVLLVFWDMPMELLLTRLGVPFERQPRLSQRRLRSQR